MLNSGKYSFDTPTETYARYNGPYGGEINTERIIAAHGTNSSAAWSADEAWVQQVPGGPIYQDYYLPSLKELELIYENLVAPGLWSVQLTDYMSSNEASVSTCHLVDFSNGQSIVGLKDDIFRFLIVQKF